ncbi:NADH-quinone oxidoreductase subunit H [Pseudodesulfovibrio sediminis]|uniref:Ech hydrogenase subunit EchB n=1 Tax=Pseudodesulfovibrio sediminis TaxID=2810563 RepID=A0ABN6EXL5_9BACT|nr:NADH-quinone oxidoreductase subunit H [Pseudodesulfovibrio sediminis]BCS89920.1 ech hydrogenase subunit EchB [Pseudodesulfovibrio sediminis]
MTNLLIGLIVLCFTPFLGGLIQGMDRILTARVQRRVGPPLLQPFFDVIKLWAKEPLFTSAMTDFCAWGGLVGSAAALGLFITGQDLLLVFFTQAVGAGLPAVGALASPSPYSQTGGQRELLQLAAYEPVLLLILACVGQASGSFASWAPLALSEPLLPQLPLAFAALLLVTGIKFRKSPFDTAASAHAHQELVRGMYTEYSGRSLALLEVAHWLDTVLLLGICALFWASNLWCMALVVALVWLGEIVLDNASARLTWPWLLAVFWGPGLILTAVNLAWVVW